MTDTTSLIFPENKVNCKNVILIDNNVPQFMTFYNSSNENTFPIVYSKDNSRDSILGVLQGFSNIDRLSLCFVNDLYDNKMFLNNQFMLDNDNVQFIISLIKQYNIKNIDYLGCDTLNQVSWKNYYENIQNQTNVIIGASNDKTGNLKYGGDWVMESNGEDIQNIYFDGSILNYTSLLDAGSHSFIINNIGQLFGCGLGSSGALGLGSDNSQKPYFTQISGTQGATDFYGKGVKKWASGNSSTYAITTDGWLYASGANDFGQLGIDSLSSTTTFTRCQGSVFGLNIVSVKAGFDKWVVALDLSGNIHFSGYNEQGQFGYASPLVLQKFEKCTANIGSTATSITTLNIKQITAGYSNTYFLTDTGVIYSAGSNGAGQLGNSSRNANGEKFFDIVPVPNNRLVAKISAGTNFFYAITTLGILYCCGSNASGQLGNAAPFNTTVLNLLAINGYLNGNSKNVVCAASHVLIQASNNEIFGAGLNASYELGLGNNTSPQSSFLNITSTATSFPSEIKPLGSISNIYTVSNTSFIISNTGSLYVAGPTYNNGLGQITSTPANSTVFTKVTNATTYNGSSFNTAGQATLPAVLDFYSEIVSNICFLAGSMVLTDQGLKPIEKIDTSIHTINSKPILHVTKTYTIDEHLVCINKHAFGKNVPNKKTIVSKNHLIMYNKKLIEAKDLVYLNNSVEFVENTGELLYNLLLEKRTLMSVNNLIAETLDPKNIVAKSYLGQMTEEEKTTLLNNNYQHLDKLDKIRNKKLLK